MTTSIAREDLIALVEQTWQTLFADVVEESPDADESKWDISSRVAIHGAWNGSAVVLLDQEAARQLAARMLDTAPDELSREEILDAAGEIANILGGNLKSMLPQPSQLGLPEVQDATHGSFPVSSIDFPSALHCVWGNAHFSVMIGRDARISEP